MRLVRSWLAQRQRAYAGAYPDTDEEFEEPEYVPVRGKVRFRFRGVIKSVTGRIVLGVVAFLALGSMAIAAVGPRCPRIGSRPRKST